MKHLYIIYNYGRAANGQDVGVGNALSREAFKSIIYHDWNHLTCREKQRIGSIYNVYVYSVPDRLGRMTADEVEYEMLLEGLIDDDFLTNSFEIDANDM